jgi:hypothetical protein
MDASRVEVSADDESATGPTNVPVLASPVPRVSIPGRRDGFPVASVSVG